ncbi:MAG: TIGR03619 family F420-dependent LLM class oxidoreductase [Gammaproteobacteria bacterium]|nr:TIGR03619 family F420-dependent LLM class oxidoreductase [Gammaproteobacteria bacterium]
MPRFGVCLLPTDRTLPPPALARAVEERGLDMLFFAENSHVPIKHRKNAYHRDDFVEPFARMHDSLTALAACAAVTTRIQLGTGVCLLTERDPIITAKAVATLDHLSNGRVVFGIAGGWIKEAMEHHGSPFRERWRIVRERALAIRTLWRDDPAEFHGEYVDFEPLWLQPKPLQPGGPPIYIGSNSDKVPARVAEYADGWMPIYDRYAGDPLTDLAQACDAAGRDFDEMTVLLFGAPRDPAVITDFAARGCDGFVFLVTPEELGDVPRALDELVALRTRTGL